MEFKKKFSFTEHGEVDAINYCGKCKIYLCKKCETFHSKLFKNHPIFAVDDLTEAIFTGFCQEDKHEMELLFFCKNHNQLCCAACLCKINKYGNGKHKDCDVCCLEDIKEEKKKQYKENIKTLEELSNTLQESIADIKKLFEKINENKDELKSNIQKTFTRIRNEINNREDELLLEIDKTFEKVFFNEEIIKNGEKLPNRIKMTLEKGKELVKEIENNDKKINLIINDCIYIENMIKDTKKIKERINKNPNKTKIIVMPKEEGINLFLSNIKKFGRVFTIKFLP